MSVYYLDLKKRERMRDAERQEMNEMIFSACAEEQKQIFRIAEYGESVYHIVAHQYADETVRFACSELQKYILKATGTAIPYYSDRCPMRGPEIRVGANVRGETEVETGLKEDGFRIRAMGEHITITGSNSRGVLYGVYRFLEIYLGYRCFTMDAEVIEKKEILDIELGEISEEPDFLYREAYFRRAFDGGFCSKNRLNSNMGDISRAQGGRMKWYNFHHSFMDLVPERVYFEEHPEYFSEIDGVRQRNSQLCLTNPEVAEIAEKQLRKWIVENPECRVFSIGQNDNCRRCTCEKCMAIEKEEGSPAGPMIRFVNQIADSIKDDYPDVLLHTFAYQYTLPAPKKAVARDNVIVRLCSISCHYDTPFEELAAQQPDGREAEFVNALRDWASHARELYVWDYAVNFRNYLQPMFHFHVMAENIRYFRRTGVTGVLEQGNFAYGGGASGDDLKSYLIARLLWNADADVDELIHEFCMGVFGEKAGAHMEEYYRHMEKACQSAPLSIYQRPYAEYITDAVVEQADEIVKRAIETAETEEYRSRAKREYLAVRYLQLTRMEMNEPDRDDLIDAFIADCKAFGLTELIERTSMAGCRDIMKKARYADDHSDRYSLYYIMQ